MNPQQTTFVDAAADNIITNRYASGNGFTGQRSRIQCGAALQYDPIQRNSFAGLYHNGVSDGNLIRIHFFQFTVLLQICIVRSDVHQRRNGFPGFAHRIAFKQLTDPVEQHNYHRFRILLGTDGAYGGKHHQEVFVKNLTVGNVPQCFEDHVPTDQEVWHKEYYKTQPTGYGQQLSHQKQHCCNQDAI